MRRLRANERGVVSRTLQFRMRQHGASAAASSRAMAESAMVLEELFASSQVIASGGKFYLFGWLIRREDQATGQQKNNRSHNGT